MVSNVFLIPRTDVIVVLLVECGLVLCAAGLCYIMFHHRKAGRNELYLKHTAAALRCNHIREMCGIPIILHESYR